MHYYQFNIADYRKDTAHLSAIEHFIYRELLDWMYLDECEIPKDNQKVLRRLRLGSENEPELINVLSDFFKETADGWIQERVFLEVDAYKAKLEQLRENGKKGGRPRKSTPNADSSNGDKPKGLQKDSKSKPDVKATNNQELITNNQSKTPRARKDKSGEITIDEFMSRCEESGTDPIPITDAVFTNAEKLGLPPEFLSLYWNKFLSKHSGGKKKYTDWRQAFRNAVNDNWYKLWWIDTEGTYQLTTAGKQAQKLQESQS